VAYASWEASVTEDSTKAEAMPLYNIVHLANNYCFLEVIFENDCAFINHLYKGMASAFTE
jgi:hypothetical protein